MKDNIGVIGLGAVDPAWSAALEGRWKGVWPIFASFISTRRSPAAPPRRHPGRSPTAHQMFMQASSAGFSREDDSVVIKIFPGIELPPAKAAQ